MTGSGRDLAFGEGRLPIELDGKHARGRLNAARSACSCPVQLCPADAVKGFPGIFRVLIQDFGIPN